MDCTIFRIY